MQISGIYSQRQCIRKNLPGAEQKMVCVCNKTYCDDFPQLPGLNPTQAAIYVSSISGKRFELSVGEFLPVANGNFYIQSLNQLCEF